MGARTSSWRWQNGAIAQTTRVCSSVVVRSWGIAPPQVLSVQSKRYWYRWRLCFDLVLTCLKTIWVSAVTIGTGFLEFYSARPLSTAVKTHEMNGKAAYADYIP